MPYGRGGSPIQNMILRDHTTSEVCSLLMVEDFDAGPIYLRDGVSLDGTLDEILVRIYNIIGEQIKILIKEEIEPKKQKGSPTVLRDSHMRTMRYYLMQIFCLFSIRLECLIVNYIQKLL